MKSSIKSYVSYCTRKVEIDVFHIENNLSDLKKCEDKIKDMIKTKRIKKSRYYFKDGSTETIRKDHWRRFKNFAKPIVEKYKEN